MKVENVNFSSIPIEDNLKQTDFGQKSPNKKFPVKKILISVLSITVLFIISSLVMYFLRNKGNSIIDLSSSNNLQNSNSVESTIENPLTGVLFPIKDAQKWYLERPLAVMINNYIDARMQSGLEQSDLVYEIVAEGGITRFLAFFLSETPEKIGPVRSTREYYLVLVKELGDALLMHEGYSPQAKEAIDVWPVRSLFRGGASQVANWRDDSRDVAFEHTLFTNGQILRDFSKELGWEGNREFKVYSFKDDFSQYQDMPAAKYISIDFWYEGDYSAIFQYDETDNTYLRFTGYDSDGNPIKHIDNETGNQIKVKNLIVQFVSEVAIDGDDKNRLEYELIGSGTGYVFLDGKIIETTWTKEGRDERTMFYDSNGQEVKFNRGKFWISIVPDRNVEQVVYN